MQTSKNSFLTNSFPPNWKLMDASRASEDISEAIAVAERNLSSIKNLPDSALTFENCPRAFDRATDLLDCVWRRVSHLQNVADNPEIRDVVNANNARVTRFYSSISLDDALYAKMKTFAESPASANLGTHQKKLLEEILSDFEEGGAGLPPEKKAELIKVGEGLAEKTQKFSENVLDATNAWTMLIEDEAELAGLPESSRSLAAKKAEQRGKRGWLFTLEQPSYVPFLTYADSAKRREEIWRAQSSLALDGEFSNKTLMREILQLRERHSAILGDANFADEVLKRRMAKTGSRALSFIEELHSRFAEPFKREWLELLDFAKSLQMSENGKIHAFDSAYISEKLRKSKYDFDAELLRPYFPLNSVLKGMFEIFSRLFGIKVEKLSSASGAWDDSVELFQVKNSEGKVLGLFYADFFPRQNKRSGAWMDLLEPASEGKPALGLIAANISEPVGDKPALLSHDEVETLFHEFGHLTHFFLMDSPELGLREVAWDFVELPSQIMENWTRYKECLDLFASRWDDDSKIPEDLFERFDKSRKFMGASFAMRQLAFARIDLLLHIFPQDFLLGDIEQLARVALKDYRNDFVEESPTILSRFTHIFGDPVGYAAGYYSYKWAEVLDADAFTKFRDGGLLNPEIGREFADKILRVGQSISPEEAFRAFMGREANLDALVERSVNA